MSQCRTRHPVAEAVRSPNYDRPVLAEPRLSSTSFKFLLLRGVYASKECQILPPLPRKFPGQFCGVLHDWHPRAQYDAA
jgi:hypothetical protein